jgi:signal transduction histidine kinase
VTTSLALDPAPRLDVDAHGPWVSGDRRRVDRIVTDLCENACHHAGGPVRVGVTRCGDHARLVVDDAGPGVPVEVRERIFERFHRGEAAGDRGATTGTGLGLALVAQHVRRLRGRVWVEDRPGGGARFVVELPVDTTDPGDDVLGRASSGT